MAEERERGWCSGCWKKTWHRISERNLIRRDRFVCASCEQETIRCTVPGCDNFACNESWYKVETCAEHDGAIASFERAKDKISRLEDYVEFLEPDKLNWARGGKIAALSIGGAVVMGPAAFSAAQAIGGAIGSTFITGAGGATLSGAAASNAGLAALGLGSVASGGYGIAMGTSVVTAFGAGVGGIGGMRLGSAYLGDVKGFELDQIKPGRGPAVVVSNGFLSQDSDDQELWEEQLDELYPKNPWYMVRWESKRLKDLGDLIGAAGGRAAFKASVKKAASRATKEGVKKLTPVFWIMDAMGLAKNDWHVARIKAEQAGTLLGDALGRTRRGKFILIGHSLGARVMHQALVSLGSADKAVIDRAHLMGGAVDRGNKDDWKKAARATRNGIRNYYSSHDYVLSILYRVAQFGTSSPIGLKGVEGRIRGIRNIDVSSKVDGHMAFKPNMHRFLDKH